MTAPGIMMAALLASTPGQPCSLAQPSPVVQAQALAPALPPPSSDQASATPVDAGDDAIVVTARQHVPGDPMHAVNQTSYAVTQRFDHALVAPIAEGYRRVVPSPVRAGLRNFFRNMHEPIVFVNFLLQLKPGKAVRTLGRFAVNSTAGGAGLFDMARRRPFNLPHRPNGFANTLAYYGVRPGPFLYLPLFGATTLRDLVGRGVDMAMLPVSTGGMTANTAYVSTSTAVRTLDRRAAFDMQAPDPQEDGATAYASARDTYLAGREAEIAALKGRPSNSRPIQLVVVHHPE